VPARRDLVAHRIAVANQLRAHLQMRFPGAVGLFAEIDSTSACGSWNASPPKIAPTGSRPRDGLLAVLGGLLRAHPARHTLHTRLRQAPAGTTGPTGDTAAVVTAAFVSVLPGRLS
jgi:hypothetical protein